MRVKTSRSVLTVTTFAALVTVGLVAPAAAEPGATTQRARVTTAMEMAVKAGTPGMVAVVDTGSERFSAARGSAFLHTPIPPRSDGRFRIGSVSKTFTATLVLQLAGESKISLDDPIERYLPGLLPYEEVITIRQLLQHTSGLPRTLPPEATWASLPELTTERFVHFTPDEVVRKTATQPLLFAPGTDWSYSNTGYTVLGMLVEQVTGLRYEAALRQRILEPLHLDATQFVRDFPVVFGAAARGYEQIYPQPRPKTDVTTFNLSRFFGAGTIISTGADLNDFFDALLGGQLLSDAMLAAMKTTVPLGPGEGYGLGLTKLSLDPYCVGEGPVVWGHNGSVPGYSTWSMHTANTDVQLTSMANQSVTSTQEARGAHLLTMISAFCTPEPAPAQAGAQARMLEVTA